MRIDTQVAIVGAGPAGLLLSHLLQPQGRRVGRHRDKEPGLRRAPRARGRAGAGHGGCPRRVRRGRAHAPRRARPSRHRVALRRARAPHRLSRADRRALDHGLRAAGAGEGPRPAPARGRRANPVRGGRCRRARYRVERAARALSARRRGGRPCVPHRRGVRRLPRRVPGNDTGGRALVLRTRLSRSRGWAYSRRRRRRRTS